MPVLRAFLLALLIPALVPQVPVAPGAIAGRVTDQYGDVLPGVEVTVAADRWWRETLIGTSGEYRFASVPSGRFTVWFKRQGFDTTAIQGVAVESGRTTPVDARLKSAAFCDHCATTLGEPYETAVHVETTAGSFILAIDTSRAPITSTNFLTYVDGHLYDGGRFHRATRVDNYTVALPNRPLLECIQAGINPDKKAQVLPPIPLERTSTTGLKHVVGTVSMARGGPDSATSDFFILLNDQPSLDFGGKRFDDEQGAAAFGRVVSGMDVVRKIQQQPTKGQSLEPPITILSAKRVTP
jgi:peptidyl-prolyl cis-trans isomerase A (cyclophilin A)